MGRRLGAIALLAMLVRAIVPAGYMLATHIHAVAGAAARALTVPQGDVAALNAKVDGLGDKLQAVAQSVAQPVANAIGNLPQPSVAPAPAAVPAPAA